MNPPQRMISVDPGVGGTGVAVWKGSKLYESATLHSYLEIWERKAFEIADEFLRRYVEPFKAHTIVLEKPAFMAGAGGTMVARSGDLVKLCLLTGMLVQAARQKETEIRLVLPTQWKGQLPKDVTKRRVIEALGYENQTMSAKHSDHAFDAVGIGLWVQGRFM